MSTTTEPGRIASMASRRMSRGAGRPGTCSGGDDDIGMRGGADDEVATAIERFFAEFGRVASPTFGIDAAEIDVEEFCSEGADLFSRGGADIESLDNGAVATGGCDGLQACHPGADDEYLGGRDGSGGGHQHGEEAGQDSSGVDDGFIARDGSHG